MGQTIFATHEEIENAASILINEKSFDEEKIEIIKCNVSKDIKACPGSGKTTALLAKIIILANRMPLENNEGICVLTHTNVAINEIKNKLGIKAEVLFRYPNHFGTIQSFVDKFLAIPYSTSFEAGRIKKISDDIYNKSFERSFKGRYYRLGNNELSKRIYSINKSNSFERGEWDFLFNLRLGLEEGNFVILKNKSKIMDFHKPRNRNQKSYTDWTENEREEIKEWYIDTILNTHKFYNVLNYQDAYLYAKKYLLTIPSLKDAFSKRFKYVFLDEMQDSDTYQIDVINSVFDETKSIVQFFGDPLQSIYNSIKSDEIWQPKDPLYITTSKRFGNKIGKVLKTVCFEDNSALKSNEKIDSLQPTIILFTNPDDVIPKYCELISTLKIDKRTIWEQSIYENKPIKAIGWVGEKNDPNRDDNQLTIQSYFNNFKKNLKRYEKVDYNSLSSFLRKQNTNKLQVYSSNIIDALLHVLSIGNIKIQHGNIKRSYTKTILLDKLRSDNYSIYRDLLIHVAKWSKEIQSTESNNVEVLKSVKQFINSDFMEIFGLNDSKGYIKNFLESKPMDIISEEELKSNNIYKGGNGINIELGTIHSVKGETHCATLYLETSYYGEHESQRIIQQLCGSPIKGNVGSRIKETLKMAYVGMSRPRYFLCLAIHKDRYVEELNIENGGLWQIIDISGGTTA
jgi:hypothetical protein